MMENSKCEYEKQREANIKRNQEKLRELGLGDALDSRKAKPEPKQRKLKPSNIHEREPRRSPRVTNAPCVYTELTDEYYKREGLASDDDDSDCHSSVSKWPKRVRRQAVRYEDTLEEPKKTRRPSKPSPAAHSKTTAESLAYMPTHTINLGTVGTNSTLEAYTSRTNRGTCPICYKPIPVAAGGNYSQGYVFLKTHPCQDGVVRKNVVLWIK